MEIVTDSHLAEQPVGAGTGQLDSETVRLTLQQDIVVTILLGLD